MLPRSERKEENGKVWSGTTSAGREKRKSLSSTKKDSDTSPALLQPDPAQRLVLAVEKKKRRRTSGTGLWTELSFFGAGL
jgi:hypothetical protein